jgi:hypothetical protein
VKSCRSCHGATKVFGFVPPLVSWEDLQVPQSNGAKMFDLVKESVHAPTRPMPPVGRLSDAELKTIDDWIAGGAKNTDRPCGGSPSSPAPSSTGQAPTSGNPCATSDERPVRPRTSLPRDLHPGLRYQQRLRIRHGV